MTNLEFINQNIFDCKKYIEHLENKIIEDEKYPSLVKDHKERIEEIKPILNQLQQIKNILEAWEEFTTLFYITIDNFGNLYISLGEETVNTLYERVPEKYINSFKKALELE